jgi:hypothetical protein
MLHLIVKILALLTVAALVIGMAAECVTLIGWVCHRSAI